MSTLLDLPDELLLLIIDELYDGGCCDCRESSVDVSISALCNLTFVCRCERSVGTVFQLPNPDAIYSRDEEKKRCGRLLCIFGVGARPTSSWRQE
jgi:hypothetical protein